MIHSLTVLLLLTQFVPWVKASTPQQTKNFTDRVVEFTISDIAESGPSRENATFVSRSMDLLWPRRRDLLRVTSPYISSVDSSKAAAAMEILYRLRGYHPIIGFGFSELTWQKENSDFFSEIDAFVYKSLDHLLQNQDNTL